MSIRIDSNQCRKCGLCVEACPGNLIKRDGEGRAYIKRPEDCWGCTSCLKECHFGAIYFYLGADIGGRGSVMHTEHHGDLCDWIIEPPDAPPITITVDRRSANQY
ncbi:MAG: ferredoxin family protein [Candidatus Onthomonas sp.]|nr:ferredoxin family protein [Candidatus Onthomonas sp.]